ncbi:MAG: hypothetical protein PVI30_22645, partial [Myxococcales bacterium]
GGAGGGETDAAVGSVLLPDVVDGGMADGTSSPASGCTPEGGLRCSGAGSAQRQECVGGVWVAADPCPDGELCDSGDQEQPGSCLAAAEFCQGRADERVCVDGVMHTCNADAISESQLACDSQRLCQLGLAAGACATCLPGEDHRCEGAELHVCNDAGTGYELKEPCATVALCNAEAGACTDEACLADSFNCTVDDVLQECNAGRTAFEEVRPCDAGLCDETGGQCDVCSDGDATCMDGNPATCASDGQGWDVGSCTAPRSLCVGQGACVECAADEDCTSPPPRCRQNLCNLGAGTCTTAITGGAACTLDSGGAGVCTTEGACVECVGDAQCNDAAAPRCDTTTGTCVPCLENGDCSTSMQCRVAYCDTGTKKCALAVDEGASCGALDVCNADGDCVDCIADGDCGSSAAPHCDTSSYSCVECTSSSHCTTGSETRCDTGSNTCVECTSNSHCASRTDGRTRCNTSRGECVECTTASQCGNTIDFDCQDDTCVRIPRCGNGIIERSIGEQCDDPAMIGQGTCTNQCQIDPYYSACNFDASEPCAADATCGEIISGEPRFCAPWCSPDVDCPDVVGWDEVCMVMVCMIDCSSDGQCPLGYSCTRTDFSGSSYDVCVLN